MADDGRPSSELQAVLDAAVDAVILIDGSGTIEVFSRAAERLFGYAAGELIGSKVNVLMTAADRELHDAYMQRYERTGVPHIIGIGREVEAQRKDGSVFPAFLSVGRIGAGGPARYVGFLQDLTLRDQALGAVVRERDRASRYLEAVQTILLALDLQGCVTLINRKGCEVLGYGEKELIGADWFQRVVDPLERDGARGDFAAFVVRDDTDPLHTEYQIRTRSGVDRVIAWRYVRLHGNGEPTGILCSGDDVTDARRAQQEAHEAREQMMHVSRLATMGEMAAGISHEINQPLAAITTYAQAARRLLAATEQPDPDIMDALEQIAAQALRAGEIIRRLRSLVRNRQTQREPTSINLLIEELGTLTRADARLHDVRVRLELAAGLPELRIDPIQIQQVLLNLVRNAVQALEYQESAAREILISTLINRHGEVEVRVCDTGGGVSEDMRDQLFLPFVTTKSDGTGLGLAISRSIIEAHEGTLNYEPNAPRGACFVIRLPAREDSTP